MPKVLDPGEGEHKVRKYRKSEDQVEKDAAAAAQEIGEHAGLSAGVRWAYWQYLHNWKRCGEKGRRWTARDVAVAHKKLAEAVAEGNNERIAGFRKFLLLDEDCGESKTNSDKDTGTSESRNGDGDSQGGNGDVQDKPAVRPRKKRRPQA